MVGIERNLLNIKRKALGKIKSEMEGKKEILSY
jgi:hypothetical protein